MQSRISSNRLRVASVAMVSLIVLGLAIAATPSARAQTYGESLLHSFKGAPDGASPAAGLIRDAAGNLYGTTLLGGDPSCTQWQGNLCGVVFKIANTGTEKVLYRFTGTPDAASPLAGVVRDAAGNLYGTAWAGGVSGGCGAVYKVSKGKETVLHSFGATDGCQPDAALIRDKAGNLYGTTGGGGPSGYGTVFKLDTSGTETVLHFFGGPPDGESPFAGLVRDAKGNFYGTTINGGIGYGTVYEVFANGTEKVLYSFTGGVDGGYPYGGLVRDPKGNLYGTTEYGGPGSGTCEGGDFPAGCGVLFKVDTSGNESVIYSFTGTPDGFYPLGGLVRDAAGNLYGTTLMGGKLGFGTVFKVRQNGKRILLHSFRGGTKDGANPYGGVIRDAAGNFYGTTYAGGRSNNGTVFKLTPE
jgi:uncharacterized repeat protein (TIGR03803 family)